jgi:hypothetical protein
MGTLCWEVLDLRPKPNTYRAPSWSWASIDGKIILDQGFTTFDASFIDVSITTSSEDQFGEVSAGVLVVLNLCCEVLLPCQIEFLEALTAEYSVEFSENSTNVDIRWDCEESFPTANTIYYFLPMLLEERHNYRVSPPIRLWGLVLQPTRNKRG